MCMSTPYSVKMIVKESSYRSDYDNNHDPFSRKCGCTKPPTEGFWWWLATSANFSMVLLYFQTNQPTPTQAMLYRVSCRFVFRLPPRAEVQPSLGPVLAAQTWRFASSPFPAGTVQVLRNRHELCPLLLLLPTCLIGTFL